MLYCNELLFFCFAMMNAKRHSKIFLTEAGAGFGGGLLKHGRNEKTICPAGKRQIRIAVDFGKRTVRFPFFLSACGVKKNGYVFVEEKLLLCFFEMPPHGV